ncbi:hypothetical protein ACVILI_000001, partial [Mesorhizobium sp. USDA 4775]
GDVGSKRKTARWFEPGGPFMIWFWGEALRF